MGVLTRVTAAACRPLLRLARNVARIVREEATYVRNDVRSVRPTLGFALALFCVALIIVGNVILLIAINFWIATFPAVTVQHNSSQIALQSVVALLLLVLFGSWHALFMCYVGPQSSWRVLVATDRMGSPRYRLFLLVVSGAAQAVTNLLATYSMTYTPAFIQAILLCCVPFATQAWTVVFIREERQRNYWSVLFVASFACFVAGVLLASTAAFVVRGEQRVPWSWSLVYLLSSITFGLWCVVQRLYLDAVLPRDDARGSHDSNSNNSSADGGGGVAVVTQSSEPCVLRDEPRAAMAMVGSVPAGKDDVVSSAQHEQQHQQQQQQPGDAAYMDAPLLTPLQKRQWGRQAEDDLAAKFVLLVLTLLFQAVINTALFPVDALPWFGTSSSVRDAWRGLCQSFDFIFASWYHIRYGLLYSLGIAMSYVGCIYLSEHSPTLASVVMQLAGPVTSIMLLLVPAWNLMREDSPIGYKVGGVVLLFCAALLYHFWEQRSVRLLTRLQHDGEHEQQQQQQQGEGDSEAVGVQHDKAVARDAVAAAV